MANADFRPRGIQKISRVTTVDAVGIVGQTVPVPADGVYLLDFEILAKITGPTTGAPGDSACYNRTIRVTRHGGALNISTPQTDYTSADQKTWRVSFAGAGLSVQAVVQGALGNTVGWTLTSSLRQQL